jgi:hypothetical protein
VAAGLSPTIWSAPIRLYLDNGARAPLMAVPSAPGVYRIRVLRSDGLSEPISRTDGADDDGILHIGKSGDLQTRVKYFQGAAAGGKAASQAGWNFNNYRFVRRYPLVSLAVDWYRTANVLAARQLEHQLHEDYQFRFLDRPPLDAQG